MLTLIALVVSLGLADSINPSTVVPALYYATTVRARAAVAEFALGVFVVSFAGGVLVLLGGRELVTSLVPHVGETVKHLAELGAGLVLLGIATAVWLMRARVAERVERPGGAGSRSALAVGGAIMLVELPSAFPYFAAIAAIAASNVHIAAQVALVGLYSVLFVLPLVGIFVATTFAGDRAERALRSARDWTQRNAAAVLAATLTLIGLVCLGLGIGGLA